MPPATSGSDPTPPARYLDRAWATLIAAVVAAASVLLAVEIWKRPCRCEPRVQVQRPKEREPITRFGEQEWTWHVGILSKPGTVILYLGDESIRLEAPERSGDH